MEFEQTSLLREANMPFMARVFGAENTKYSNKNNNNTKMKMMQVNAEEVGVAAQEHLRHDRLRAWQYSLPANIEHSASHPLVWGHENHEVVATKIAGGASHHAADIFTDEDRRELRAELLAAAQEQPQHSSSPGLFRQRMRELQTRVEEQMEVHRGISRAMLDLDRLEREARQQRAEAHTQTLVHLLRQRQSSVLRRVFGGDDDGLNFTTTPTPQQPTTTTTTTQQPTTTTTTTSTAQPTQAPTTTGVVPTTQTSSSASPALQDLLKTFSQPRRKPATTTTTNDARVADVAPRVVSRVDVVQPPPPPPSYIITRWVRVEPATSTPTREEEHEETIISNNNTNTKMDELHEVESKATSVRDDASSVAPSSVVEEVDDDDDAHEAASSSSTSSLSTHVADDADDVASSMEDVASIPEDDGVASAILSEVVDDVVDDLDDDLHRHHHQQRVDGMNVAALREVLEQFYVACKHGNALTSALISAPPTTLKDVLPQNNKKNDGDDDGDTMEEDDVRVRRATMREADAELLRWRQLLASDVANVRHLRTFLQHLRHNINMMDLQRKAHRAKMVQLRKAQKLAKVVQRMRQRPQMSVDEVVDDLDENFFSENNNNKHRNREWKRKQMRHLLTGDADDDDVRDDDDIVEEMDFDVQDVVGSDDDVVDDVVGYMSGSENDDGSIASMEWDVDDDDVVGRRSPLFGVDVEDILDGLVDAEVTSVMEEDVLDAFETHFVQQLVSVDVDEIDDDVVAELEGYSDVDEIEYPPAWRSRTTKRAAAPSTSSTSLVVDEVEDLINDDETSPQQQQQQHLPSSSSASSVAEQEASDVDGSIHSNNKSSTEHEHEHDDDDALEMMEDLLAEDEEEMNELRADIERTRPRRQRALRQVRPTTFTEIYTTQETPHDGSKDDDGDDASSSPQQEHVADAAQHVDDEVEVAPQAEVAPHPSNDVVALHDDDVQHASTNVGTDLAMDFAAQVSWVEQQRRLFSDILPVTSRAQHDASTNINDDDHHDDVQVRAFTHHWGVVESLMQTKFGRHRVWPSYQLMSDEDEDGGDDDHDDVLDDWSSELDTSTYSSDA